MFEWLFDGLVASLSPALKERDLLSNGSTLYTAINAHNYIYMISASVLYYDHLLTLPSEIRLFWNAPKTKGFYLFVVHRYLGCFGHVFLGYRTFGWEEISDTACTGFRLTYQLLIVAMELGVMLLLALRTYALYGKSWKILTLVLLVALIGVAVSLGAITNQRLKLDVSQSIKGCPVPTSYDLEIVFAAPWICLMTYDVLIFVLTLWKSYYSTHVRGQLLSIPIVKLIMRDGAIYSGTMVTVNVLNLLTYFIPHNPLGAQGCLNLFVSSISVTMMSRLLLNLRANDSSLRRRPAGSSSERSSTYTTANNASTAPAMFTTHFDEGEWREEYEMGEYYDEWMTPRSRTPQEGI